jgi:hypothetical protein
MKTRRLLIAAMWLNLLAVTATAETLVVRPDLCAAPADAPRIISLRDVEAVDLNPDRAMGKVLVLYPVAIDGWASARILARFDLEGESRRAKSFRSCRTAR